MWINWLLVLSFLIIVPILYFVMKNDVKPKKNIILGVTLPLYAREDSQVQAECRRFVHRLTVLCLVLFLLPLPLLACPYISVVMLALFVWLIPACFGPMVLFGFSNRQLMRLKKENHWFSPLGEGPRTVVDLQAAVQAPFRLRHTPFIVAGVLSLAAVVGTLVYFWGSEDRMAMVSISLSFAVLVWMCWPMCMLLIRRKAEAVGDDTGLNVALTQVRRKGWYTTWLLMVWASLVLQLVAPFANTWWFVDAPLVYAAVICAGALFVELRVRGCQQTLTAASGSDGYADEDDYWLFGQFYYNKNDSHLVVNDRVGINTSVNLARPAGAVLMGACMLVVLLLPLFGVWMVGEELSPIECTVQGETLEIRQAFGGYTVRGEQVTGTEVLEELPELRKRVGSDYGTLCKGDFSVEGYGTCTLLLDPRDEEFLVVHTQDKTYIFSFRGEQDAGALARMLYPAGA